ncbi:50S ribosomal protein L18 [Candidatus Profftella armatura]|uniref:Large ribosomal subunit protein uL18 n=1 Tax=Candidatus Profftella armatura TaxID=669502 RepID=S5R0L5_9PROT|nr:50S ribosomal protein L18 [Candidatus Profftella armatura]AGS06742.1 50S ribosomal protein L18 [Candidatus Profftella armatura]ALC95861.1 50S ribosomal protein L18 [Candidatus Profftella armatura]QLK13656.1 50S ribosomal protein L18 [Candidatus Profftella armatura]
MNKIKSRLRRARKVRIKISELGINRLMVHRTNLHIYANIISSNAKILISASTLEKEVRLTLNTKLGKGGNTFAASIIGQRIAKKALKIGITKVAFDRSGFRYHGRIKFLADAARKNGLNF